MPSPALDHGISTLEEDWRGRLLGCVADGLHAMAQPLTILRSSVAASIGPEVDSARRQRYLEMSVQQIERLCGLFECLQDLVIAGQFEAECAPIELCGLLAQVAGDQQPLLQASGIELRAVLPDGPLTVSGDVARTLQALLAGLKVAAALSNSGDIIELSVEIKDKQVELTVRGDRTHTRSLNSSEHLTLSLAQANILSQRGEFECTYDPFQLHFALPLLGSVP
jgi:signal transduction histidine kinase